MSKYRRYYNKNQQVYREMADRWVRWSKSAKLTSEEVQGTRKFFYAIAVRFGLVTEFRELGVI